MSQSRKAIMLEANEIPFSVIDYYVQQNRRSHVARLINKGKQFETSCEDQIELDPWISWPTLHRGVIDQQHQILHLGQVLEAANEAYPPLWDVLSQNGVSVGMMGSLHSSTLPGNAAQYAFYVPDFFADTTFAHPESLAPFQAFNLAMTRKSTRNVDSKVALKEALRFLAKYLGQGVTISTIRSVFSVLFNELREPHLKTRRRSLQPLITLDIFLHFMKQTSPGFATLHANHVAAAMHRYWAAAFPNDLPENPMPLEWRAKFKHEIDYAMDVFDVMVGRLLAFVDAHPSYKLMVASSLGQAAVKTKPSKGFVTILDVERLMQTLGVAPGRWSQRFAMAPCISVVLQNEADADAFEKKLLQISVGEYTTRAAKREIPPLSFDHTGSSFQLYFYFEAYEGEWKARIGEREVSFQELGMGFHAHQDEVACSARHTPDGIFIVYDPTQRAVDSSRSRISTLDIAPAILDAYGIAPKPYMHQADPTLLDSGTRGTRVSLSIKGGGVEKAVQRVTELAG